MSPTEAGKQRPGTRKPKNSYQYVQCMDYLIKKSVEGVGNREISESIEIA